MLFQFTHITDDEGNVLNRYEYDAFGNFMLKEETIENRFGFTGEQYDPVAGMYYLRARFYNPVIGRFIQEDTYYGDGLNLYTYCHNNPVRYVDPSGHDCENKSKAIKKLEELHPDWDSKMIAKEYDRIRQYCEDAAVARAIITGDTTGVQNSKILRANMKLDGNVLPPYANAAHHIVAATDAAAEYARSILKQYGIDINESSNGVFLPNYNALDSKYVKNETFHIGSHGGEYYRYVNQYLMDGIEAIEDAGKIVEQADIRRMLGEIEQQLLNGELKLNY